uniref:Uncharacterized protein n=1 Tax=Romanomermis culicivorax TaxID=13658 RepID=A0A915KZ44_ROMCU
MVKVPAAALIIYLKNQMFSNSQRSNEKVVLLNISRNARDFSSDFLSFVIVNEYSNFTHVSPAFKICFGGGLFLPQHPPPPSSPPTKTFKFSKNYKET